MKEFLLPFAGALAATMIVWAGIGPLVLTHLPVADSTKGLIQMGVGIVVCVLTFDFIRKKLGAGK